MFKRGVFDSIAQSEFHQPAYMRKNPALPAREATRWHQIYRFPPFFDY